MTGRALGVRFQGVEKRFGATEVLGGIDLAIAPGEFVVLLGRSGCGKSTLLRILAGLEDPTAGTIHIGDRDVTRVEPADRGVSMVFQSYALFPHMTVEENLGFPLTIRRTPAAEKRARVGEAAAMLGLEPLLARYPRELSGGQRQRVAIGRAIVRRPEIYLFDEPLSNLDAALRARMRVELKALHARLGATMVYVTHDQVEAMTLADRIALLEKGRIEQVGTPDEIYRRPRNTFVATFIGTPAMNLVAGEGGGGALTGVRPEDVSLHTAAPAPATLALRGTIEAVEPIGDRGFVHVRTERGLVVATVDGARAFGLRAGSEAWLTAAGETLHRFDASGGRVT